MSIESIFGHGHYILFIPMKKSKKIRSH